MNCYCGSGLNFEDCCN
ncbi:MAG: SEC-C domain-containing protein, partial [Gammaproteobacteria bacterium]|nr:SEC-C domain-containing protein [Gammaproteobacteria bacterium]